MLQAFFMMPFVNHNSATKKIMRNLGKNTYGVGLLRCMLRLQEKMEDNTISFYSHVPGHSEIVLKQMRDYVLWHKALHIRLLSMLG